MEKKDTAPRMERLMQRDSYRATGFGPAPTAGFRVYSHDRVAELREMFAMFDEGGNGLMGMNDVKQLIALVFFFLSEEDSSTLLAELGLLDKEFITFSEFFAIIMHSRSFRVDAAQRPSDTADLSAVFREWDPNGTGYIPVENFLNLMTQAGDAFHSHFRDELRDDLRRMGCLRGERVNYKRFIALQLSCDASNKYSIGVS